MRGSDQRRLLGARGGMQRLQRRLADAAARHVDDALEGEIVGGLVDQAEVGERVADLLPLVEARAADNPIGQADLDEALLELAGLEARPHEDRGLRELLALALQRFDLVTDPARLLLGIPDRAQPHLLALVGLGPERLAEPALVVSDQPGRSREDVRRRAVVLLEPDDLGAGKVLFEAQDVADLGAAPAVDRLIIVADAAEIAVALRQEPEPEVLGDVGVLVLVDQDVAKPMVIIREHVGVGGEQRQVVQQQIAEVDGVEREEALLILAEEFAAAAVRHHGGFVSRHLVGPEAPVLPAIKSREQHARRQTPVVDSGRRDDLLHQTQLVVGIENGEVRLESDPLGVAAENARGDRMEGAEPDPVHGGANDRLEPLAHLARRLIGESDRQQLARESPSRGQNMGEPRRQHARLAGAGARQHQHGPIYGFNGFTLRRIERCQIRRRGGGHHRLDRLGHASL